jgi:chromosome segregation ATPase
MRALVPLVGFVLSGCAVLGGPAPRLSYEARVYLLDAEEDLMTVRARHDEAQRELAHARGAVDEANERIASMGAAAPELKAEAKAGLALAVALEKRVARAVELLEAEEACADLRYAARRAMAEVRFRLEGADEAEATKLEERAQGCQDKLVKKQQALAEAQGALDRSRADSERAATKASARSPHQYPRPWLE